MTEQGVYPPQATTADQPTLDERYRAVLRRVDEAARRDGRRGKDICVVAVTKAAGIDDIRALIDLGHRDFAENRVQQLEHRAAMIAEALQRRARLPSLARGGGSGAGVGESEGVRWHMIGRLQRNKIKKLMGVVRLVHSVADLRVAEDLHAAAMKKDIDLDVLVQVNCSGEAQKNGCPMPAARHLCEQIDTMGHLRIRGLMTMAALDTDPDDADRTARFAFERCRDVFEEIRRAGVGDRGFNILSMGMTNDFEAAIECGSNMVRVGTAIFGPPAPGQPDDASDDHDDADDSHD